MIDLDPFCAEPVQGLPGILFVFQTENNIVAGSSFDLQQVRQLFAAALLQLVQRQV